MQGYVRFRSWHVIKTWTRVPGRALTLCGRLATGATADVLPLGDKSCETCLRLQAKAGEG